MDYKGLKKIISLLGSDRPASKVAALAIGHRQQSASAVPPAASVAPLSPSSFQLQPDSPLQADQTLSLLSSTGQDDDRGPDFQAHKTAFFFKLERDLEKVVYMHTCTGSKFIIRLTI